MLPRLVDIPFFGRGTAKGSYLPLTSTTSERPRFMWTVIVLATVTAGLYGSAFLLQPAAGAEASPDRDKLIKQVRKATWVTYGAWGLLFVYRYTTLTLIVVGACLALFKPVTMFLTWYANRDSVRAGATGESKTPEKKKVTGEAIKKMIKVVPKPYGKLDDNGVLWNPETVGKPLKTPKGGFTPTAYHMMVQAVVRGGSGPAVGSRRCLQRNYEVVGGKEVEKLTLADDFDWMTYADYGAKINRVGAAFVGALGVAANERVLLYADTCLEWMLTAQACWTQSLTVVTVYATLGAEGLLHAASITKAKVLVVDAKTLRVAAAAAKDGAAKAQLAGCKKVVYIKDRCASDAKAADATKAAVAALATEGIEAIEFEELAAKGTADDGTSATAEPKPPNSKSLAVIMFTSGTTGLPKGVLLSHANLVAACAGMLENCKKYGIDETNAKQETYMAYLPLAHIMEMVIEIFCLSVATKLGYGSPHTLTATSAKIKPGACLGDAAALGPTMLIFAPAVLDKVYAGINAKVNAAGGLKKKLFELGVASGVANAAKGVIGAGPILNALVFKKVQALLGGKLKVAFAGSAPLAPKVQLFVQTCFDCPIRQGYALTETTCAGTIQEACDNSTSVVGSPLACGCLQLRDWAEGNYLLSDETKPGIMMRRGEVLIGGPAVCQGYLVDEANPDPEIVAKNKDDFFVDANKTRWFCTGDIGQITPDGNLQIIDRKKDLVKLQQGEYVALSKVESTLKECPLVEIPLCYAESSRSHCVALICPSHPALKALGASLGVATDDVAALCVEPKVVAEVSKQCLAVCKGKLVGFETPTKFGLVAETWTPENDLLTAAMKLKRVPIVAAHKAQLDALYA